MLLGKQSWRYTLAWNPSNSNKIIIKAVSALPLFWKKTHPFLRFPSYVLVVPLFFFTPLLFKKSKKVAAITGLLYLRHPQLCMLICGNLLCNHCNTGRILFLIPYSSCTVGLLLLTIAYKTFRKKHDFSDAGRCDVPHCKHSCWFCWLSYTSLCWLLRVEFDGRFGVCCSTWYLMMSRWKPETAMWRCSQEAQTCASCLREMKACFF